MPSSTTVITVVAAVVLFLDLVTPGNAWSFNCNRLGSGCEHGLCDALTGTCTCPEIGTFTGYDCSLTAQLVGKGNCMTNNPCQNMGTCFSDAPPGAPSTELCHCPDGYYGPTCALKTLNYKCFKDRMVINVNPGYRFSGTVAIQRRECGIAPLVNLPASTAFPREREGYAEQLPFDGPFPCGDGPNVTTTATDIIYTYTILVIYGGAPELDETIPISCSFANSGTAVLYSVTDPNTGASIIQPKLGSPFTIKFSVDQTSLFTDLTVDSCNVTNANRTMSQPVVQNSCPVPPFGERLVKNGAEHELTLITYMFPTDNTLDFACHVKICKMGDTSCQYPPVCPMPTFPSGGGATAFDYSLSPGGYGGAGGINGISQNDPALNDFFNMLGTVPNLGSLGGPQTGAGPGGAGRAGSVPFNDILKMAGMRTAPQGGSMASLAAAFPSPLGPPPPNNVWNGYGSNTGMGPGAQGYGAPPAGGIPPPPPPGPAPPNTWNGYGGNTGMGPGAQGHGASATINTPSPFGPPPPNPWNDFGPNTGMAAGAQGMGPPTTAAPLNPWNDFGRNTGMAATAQGSGSPTAAAPLSQNAGPSLSEIFSAFGGPSGTATGTQGTPSLHDILGGIGGRGTPGGSAGSGGMDFMNFFQSGPTSASPPLGRRRRDVSSGDSNLVLVRGSLN